MDPKAEKYDSWSPYNYVANNPTNLTDPNGRGPELALFLVPGLGQVLLAATVATAVTIVAIKVINDNKAGYREQQKREGASQRETSKIQQKHAESVNNNIGEPTPDGDNTPRGGGSNIGKVAVGVGLAAEFTKEFIEKIDNSNQNNSSETQSNNNTETTISQGSTNSGTPMKLSDIPPLEVTPEMPAVDNVKVEDPVVMP